MALERLKKTFQNFLVSPGYTIRYFLERVLRILQLYRFASIRLANLRLAKLIDAYFSFNSWLRWCRRGIALTLPHYLEFLTKHYKAFIVLDHRLMKFFGRRAGLFAPLILKTLQKAQLKLEIFSFEQLRDMQFTYLNDGKTEAQISWVVHNRCNFKCSYCASEIRQREGDVPFDLPNMRQKFRQLAHHYHQVGMESVQVVLTGGEPTIWTPLREACQIMREEFEPYFSVNIALNTNLSRSLGWWKENFDLFDYIIASYHAQNADQDHFMEVCHFLQTRKPFSVSIMVQEDYIDRIMDLTAKMEQLKYYRYEFLPLLDVLSAEGKYIHYGRKAEALLKNRKTFSSSYFPPHIFKNGISANWIQDAMGIPYSFTSNHLFVTKANAFKGWNCFLPGSVFINGDGNVYHASCNALGSIGNFFKKEPLKLITEAIVCPHSYCLCGTDILIPKAKGNDPMPRVVL